MSSITPPAPERDFHRADRRLARLMLSFLAVASLGAAACGTTDESSSDTTEDQTTTTEEETTTTERETTTTADEAINTADWVEVSDGVATVLMPEEPQSTERTIPTADGQQLPTTIYIAEQEQDVSLSFNTFDVGPTGTYDLETGLQGVAGGSSGEVVDQQLTTVDGSDAIEGDITFEQGGTEGLNLIRIVDAPGGVVILQQVIGRASAEDDLRELNQAYLETLQL